MLKSFNLKQCFQKGIKFLIKKDFCYHRENLKYNDWVSSLALKALKNMRARVLILTRENFLWSFVWWLSLLTLYTRSHKNTKLFQIRFSKNFCNFSWMIHFEKISAAIEWFEKFEEDNPKREWLKKAQRAAQ